jgi:AcrR family transcriptional regulator
MRQSPAEIDHAILDVAAGLFATHGYAHTSVQQIADAVGYSKPGLLHRFGSKDALHHAALAEVTETVQAVVAHAAAHSEDPDQVRQVLELVTLKALERPGMVQMMLAAFEPGSDEPGTSEIQSAGRRLVELLDHPHTSPAERLRIVLAIRMIATAAMAQSSPADAALHVDRDELVPLLVDLAAAVMGAPAGP